ncbi:hypothetical protein KIPB_009756 [Kipferlia bialata]|uniref:Uncharacterized protein n=1 Tax=Kipferlia bialata TaxID=797122 RepID=A0A9K3D4A3_9EUKA|nr:hypothetical protein KIPB_009756 [Kipferlia bialata]|eukprot:g9756.t1
MSGTQDSQEPGEAGEADVMMTPALQQSIAALKAQLARAQAELKRAKEPQIKEPLPSVQCPVLQPGTVQRVDAMGESDVLYWPVDYVSQVMERERRVCPQGQGQDHFFHNTGFVPQRLVNRESVVAQLARLLLAHFRNEEKSADSILSILGVTGSGKTTVMYRWLLPMLRLVYSVPDVLLGRGGAKCTFDPSDSLMQALEAGGVDVLAAWGLCRLYTTRREIFINAGDLQTSFGLHEGASVVHKVMYVLARNVAGRYGATDADILASSVSGIADPDALIAFVNRTVGESYPREDQDTQLMLDELARYYIYAPIKDTGGKTTGEVLVLERERLSHLRSLPTDGDRYSRLREGNDALGLPPLPVLVYIDEIQTAIHRDGSAYTSAFESLADTRSCGLVFGGIRDHKVVRFFNSWRESEIIRLLPVFLPRHLYQMVCDIVLGPLSIALQPSHVSVTSLLLQLSFVGGNPRHLQWLLLALHKLTKEYRGGWSAQDAFMYLVSSTDQAGVMSRDSIKRASGDAQLIRAKHTWNSYLDPALKAELKRFVSQIGHVGTTAVHPLTTNIGVLALLGIPLRSTVDTPERACCLNESEVMAAPWFTVAGGQSLPSDSGYVSRVSPMGSLYSVLGTITRSEDTATGSWTGQDDERYTPFRDLFSEMAAGRLTPIGKQEERELVKRVAAAVLLGRSEFLPRLCGGDTERHEGFYLFGPHPLSSRETQGVRWQRLHSVGCDTAIREVTCNGCKHQLYTHLISEEDVTAALQEYIGTPPSCLKLSHKYGVQPLTEEQQRAVTLEMLVGMRTHRVCIFLNADYAEGPDILVSIGSHLIGVHVSVVGGRETYFRPYAEGVLPGRILNTGLLPCHHVVSLRAGLYTYQCFREMYGPGYMDKGPDTLGTEGIVAEGEARGPHSKDGLLHHYRRALESVLAENTLGEESIDPGNPVLDDTDMASDIARDVDMDMDTLAKSALAAHEVLGSEFFGPLCGSVCREVFTGDESKRG